MPSNITIRNVPRHVHEALAAQAAVQGLSLEDYRLQHLTDLAGPPKLSKAEWLAAVRRRKAKMTSHVTAADILEHRRADRR